MANEFNYFDNMLLEEYPKKIKTENMFSIEHTVLRRVDHTNIEDRKLKQGKISRKYRIIKGLNNLVENNYYRPEEFIYLSFSYDDIIASYKDMISIVVDRKENLKSEIEQERGGEYDLSVYSLKENNFNQTLTIIYGIYKKEQGYIKPQLEYGVQSYQSDIMTGIRVETV